MKQVYRVLAFLIAAGVILQAAAIAYAVFAMFEWVGTGGTIDKALIESENPQIGGITGFKLHQLVGVTVLPLVALLTTRRSTNWLQLKGENRPNTAAASTSVAATPNTRPAATRDRVREPMTSSSLRRPLVE